MKAVLVAAPRIRLTVVKVDTSEPGLYGLGCATFNQRAKAVVTAVDEFLAPFLKGKDPDHIEDIWQSMYVSSYWRNGPVLYNAMSGVDQALWDIKGKRANMPVYQLLGGKTRMAADCYAHASGNTFKEVEDMARSFIEEGYRHVRIQVGIPGMANYGSRRSGGSDADEAASELPPPPAGPPRERVYEPGPYVRIVPKLFEHMRTTLGSEIELLHDVHERVSPDQALNLCKELEQYKPFFIEDPLAPEQIGYFKHIRANTTTPIAMGELFNSPARVYRARDRSAHRLHARAHLANRRPESRTQAGRPLRVVRGAHRLARTGGCLADRPLRQYRAGPCLLQLRHSGENGFSGRDARGLPGLPATQGRVFLGQRETRLGRGTRRVGRGEISGGSAADALRLPLGHDAPAGWLGDPALGRGKSRVS